MSIDFSGIRLRNCRTVHHNKVIMMASRMDLCYSQMPKKEWASFRGKLASGKTETLE
jgi:hypothetical protein